MIMNGGVDMDHLRQFFKMHGEKRLLAKNDYLFRINEKTNRIYFLESGWVKVSHDGWDGQSITLFLRKYGEIFGAAEILAKTEMRERYAQCLTSCTVYSMPAVEWFNYANQQPELWQLMAGMMAARLLDTQSFVEVLTCRPVPWRLAWMLMKYAEKENGVYSTTLPLTHEEISFMIGCSRQKITEFLSRWRKKGVIDYEREKIVILQPQSIFSEALWRD